MALPQPDTSRRSSRSHSAPPQPAAAPPCTAPPPHHLCVQVRRSSALRIMSEKPAWDTSSFLQYSHMQDVSRAWDSLMEAKNVLQEIENKVDLQSRRNTQARKIRRRLEMDRGLYSDTQSEEINNPVDHEQDEEIPSISEQPFTLYRKEPDGHSGKLMSTLNPPLVSSNRNSLMQSLDQAEPCLAGYNLHGSTEKYHLSTYPQNTLEMQTFDNISGSKTTEERYFADECGNEVLVTAESYLQVPNADDAVQVMNPYLMTSPLSVQHVQDEISHYSSLVAFTPLLSPKKYLYTQKLETLKSRSPSSKLERLKERIREQKRCQEAVKNLKSRQNSELARKAMNTQKIRKVTFGPPPPVYKGFSAFNQEMYPDESAVTGKKEHMKKMDHKAQRTDHLQARKYAKGMANCPVSQKLSFKSTSPERKEKSSGYDLYGASAWRKGQKLVQKILGPSPISLRKRRVCENQEFLQRENCRRRCQRMRCQDSLKEEHLHDRQDSNQNTYMLQVLRDIQAGKEGLMTSCSSLREGFERVTNKSVSRNVSPKRPRSRTGSHDNKDFGKENIQDGVSGRSNSTKAHSYSVHEVRNYMKKKIIERQKAEQENQRKAQKALQTKREQLNNILRKQKEAFPAKRQYAKNKNNINTRAFVTSEVDKIRRDLSEWLHATSSDLLKEDRGGSGKTREQFTEEPFNNGCTSPLQLKDLSATPTIHHQDLQDDVYSKERLNPDNCPDEQSPYRHSQERVQAIWATAKDLGRRVELEINRFGAIQLNSNVTSTCSNTSPPQEWSTISKTAEQTEADKLLRTKRSKFIESKDFVLPLISNNIGSAQICNSVKQNGKMKKDQGHMMEKIAQPMKSQPKFKTKKAQKSSITYQTANKSSQKRPESHSPKITPGKTGGTKTSSPKYHAADKKGKSTMLHYGESQPQVGDLRQNRMEIRDRIKEAQLEQQEKDLAVLKLKAEMEAREAERCMQEMLIRDNLQDLPVKLRSKKMHPRDNEQEKCYNRSMISKSGGSAQRSEYALDAYLDSASNTPAAPVAHNTMKTSDKLSVLPDENDILERSWDHTDTVTDSTSKWSEVGQFYGSNMLSRFTMEMAQQYLREEELRARHQTALLKLRENALKEKTKAELALLKHQRMCWEMKKEHDKVEEILRQEEDIQKKLKQEQAEIQHLYNIYKAAHQERKLLLKQQEEILHIQQSAVDIQQKLQCSGVQVSEQGNLWVPSNQAVDSTLHNSTLSREHLHQDTESAISDLSVDDHIMEDPQAEDTKQLQNAKGNPTADGPDIHHTIPVLPNDNQTRSTQEQQMIYSLPTKQDRGDESNPLSAKSKPVMGSLQSPLTNLCQEFLMLREDLGNHSQEKRKSSKEDNLALCVGIKETHVVPEKEKRENMDFQGHEMMKKSENTDTLEKQRNLSVLTADKGTTEDTKLASEISIDRILKPSESNVPLQAQETGTLLSSFVEFHKVSAKLITISESSVSVSDQGQDGQDTESGDSDVFDVECTGIPTEGRYNFDGKSVSQPFDPNLLGESDKNNIIKSAFHNGKSVESSNLSTSQKGSLNSRTGVTLVMEDTKTQKAPLAYESFPTSEDVTESDSKTYSIENLLENQDDTTVKVTDLQKSTSMSPENISNVAGMSLSDTKDWTRMTETNVKQSFTENVISGKIETAPFYATNSKDLFQIKSFPHPSEGEVIFITDEVLQPIEDTLSEIFSPVDEKLSYGSEDLYSAKQDQSEGLPPLPRDTDSIKSDDIDSEDFPTPPDEIVFSGTEGLHSSPEASLIEEINLQYDNLLMEDAFVPTSESAYELPNDGYFEAPPAEPEEQKNLHMVVGHRTPFLTLSKAEEDRHDPLFNFEIGDRVLVKLSKPGTLNYKGSMAFRDGYWAGVVLDKAEGDNDGTFEGIRYFDCPMQCGVFVRPGQISHLLFDDQTDLGTATDDNNASGEGPSPRNFRPQDKSGSDTMQKRQNKDDKKEQSSEKNINQTRSCCLKPSEASIDKNITDTCGIYSNGVKIKPSNADRDPGQGLQIGLFCAVDTDKIILPFLLQEKQETLVLKVTDNVFDRVLSDVLEIFAKITQQKFNKGNVKQHRENTEENSEKYALVQTKTHDKLQSLTTNGRESDGCVENKAHKIVMEFIKEYIERYNKIIKKKEKKHSCPMDDSKHLQVSTS
ncbi:coiled-coil domain-containing protein 187 isoform X3 [Aquarana catesbeiana]|uniref:coiled-coil domain-containing protein 187 isoform X3 n=1 Tax=Aquarana catesbeiana TaxID=8400 RepID=UPI003CCA049B